MRVATLLGVLLTALAALLVACSDSEDDPLATITSTGTAPTEVATASAAVDATIATLGAHDREAIRALVDLQTLPCTTELGAGGPPKCLDGEADATPVEVFAYTSCEPGWVRSGDMLDAAIADLVVGEPAVVAVFDAPSGLFVSGEGVAVLLAGPDPRAEGATQRGTLALLRGDRLIELAPACGVGDDPLDLIPAGVTEFIVPPLTS